MYLRDRGQGLWSTPGLLKQGLGVRTLSSRKTNAFLKLRRKVPYESLKEAPRNKLFSQSGKEPFLSLLQEHKQAVQQLQGTGRMLCTPQGPCQLVPWLYPAGGGGQAIP